MLEALERGILCGLGTDGMCCAMPAQARAAYLIQRAARRDSSVAFMEAATLLTRNNPAIARRWFKTPRGKLAPGYQADLAIHTYRPITPLTGDTLAGHQGLGAMDAGPVAGAGDEALLATLGEKVLEAGHLAGLLVGDGDAVLRALALPRRGSLCSVAAKERGSCVGHCYHNILCMGLGDRSST